MVFGTFDGLHKGHENFLNQSKSLGDKLTIVIARDQNVEKIKSKQTTHNEKQRLNTIQKTFHSAKVILGDLNNFYQSIENLKPNIIALGYDQKANLEELKLIFPQIKIIRLKSFQPEKYKSSLLNPKD